MNAVKSLFYIRTSKQNGSGLVPIYLRVTIGKQRFDASISKFISKDQWSTSAGRLNGNSGKNKEANEYLNLISAKVYSIQKTILASDLPLTIEQFAKHWHGVKEKPRMLLETFLTHNELDGQIW